VCFDGDSSDPTCTEHHVHQYLQYSITNIHAGQRTVACEWFEASQLAGDASVPRQTHPECCHNCVWKNGTALPHMALAQPSRQSGVPALLCQLRFGAARRRLGCGSMLTTIGNAADATWSPSIDSFTARASADSVLARFLRGRFGESPSVLDVCLGPSPCQQSERMLQRRDGHENCV
jgi:hypothetical protein